MVAGQHGAGDLERGDRSAVGGTPDEADRLRTGRSAGKAWHGGLPDAGD
jgi:hypothetical protein